MVFVEWFLSNGFRWMTFGITYLKKSEKRNHTANIQNKIEIKLKVRRTDEYKNNSRKNKMALRRML